MNESGLARAGTTAAVLVVAAIAAVISFVHIEHLAVTHGQTPLASLLLPLSIDGTVAAASLVMFRAARAGLGTPWLARFMLGLSVTATLTANIAYGSAFGVAGALLSGWPAVAFIGSAEMAIGMVRRARTGLLQDTAADAAPDATADTPDPDTVRAQLNGHASKAERMFRADLEAGKVPGLRRIQTQLKVGQPKARLVQAHLRNVLGDSKNDTDQ